MNYPPYSAKRAERTLNELGCHQLSDEDYHQIAGAVNYLDHINFPWEGRDWNAEKRASHYHSEDVQLAQLIRRDRLAKSKGFRKMYDGKRKKV